MNNITEIRQLLEAYGLDIVKPLCLSWYNTEMQVSGNAEICPRGLAGDNALLILVGNSKMLWDLFVQAYQRLSPEAKAKDKNPLNTYVGDAVYACLASSPLACEACQTIWSHEEIELKGSKTGYVAFQRMASVCGLAFFDTDHSHLSIHPKFGSWYSIRCAILFHDIACTLEKPERIPNPFSMDDKARIQDAARRAEASLSVASTHGVNFSSSWGLWVELREAVSPGNKHRFSDNQILYHYTHDSRYIAA
eukprot:jgi/Picsp_1/1207/NSC_04688-R1_protein